MNILGLTEEEKAELVYLLEQRALLSKRNSIDEFYPEKGEFSREKYPKSMRFFETGKDYKMRLFMAANRIGKSLTAAYEITCHLTGRYPAWWNGKRYQFPNNWWIAGVDSNLVQSSIQHLLLGPIGEFGTGLIPYDTIDFNSLKEATKADTSVSIFRVKHISGGYSSVEFKSYESGRKSFQAVGANIWLDEEPPLPVFTECVLRTANTAKGSDELSLMMTFTPLLGISDTILNFLDGNDFSEGPIGHGKYVVMASWDDVPHLSETDKEILLAAIPPWQRDSRTRGIPQMGSGAIYPMSFESISVPRFEIPKHWKRYAGMDVGGKTAAIWLAVDPSTNIHYAYHEYYREGQLPSVHTESIAQPGQWIPIAIDSAAHGRSQIDGQALYDMYEKLGLKLHNADKTVEAGLFTCWELLSTNRIKIFNDLHKFKQEYQLYRKDEKGNVVKKDDHIMDSFRYAVMTGRNLATNEHLSSPQPYSGVVAPQYRVHSPIRR